MKPNHPVKQFVSKFAGTVLYFFKSFTEITSIHGLIYVMNYSLHLLER